MIPRPGMIGNSRFTVAADEVRVKVNGSYPEPLLERIAEQLDELIESPVTLRGSLTRGENGTINLHLKKSKTVKIVSFKFAMDGEIIARVQH
jgi:hypothetical protein